MSATTSNGRSRRGENRLLRLLFVHHNPDTYGASRSLLRLLSRIDKSKFLPIVLLAEDGPLRGMLEATGARVVIHPVHVITRPVFKSWRIVQFLAGLPFNIYYIWRLIRREKIDLVHSNSGVIVSAGPAAKLAGVPHICHIRECFEEFRGAWPFYARFILWSSVKIISVSEAMARQFPPNDKVVVIHNGFSLEEFSVPKDQPSQTFRRQFGLGQHFVVGCVGRIKLVRKGQEVLVRAASILEKKGLHAKYLFVGAPFAGNESHLTTLKELINELGLNSCVVLTGEVPDARPAYAAMDVCILPSAQPEPFGGVVMEAMAMGLPVIATNIGGSTDQVAEGETGFLVPPSNPEALAEKIEQLMNDANLRFRLGQNGPKRIAKVFSLDGMVKKFECLYQQIVAGISGITPSQETDKKPDNGPVAAEAR